MQEGWVENIHELIEEEQAMFELEKFYVVQFDHRSSLSGFFVYILPEAGFRYNKGICKQSEP